MRGRWSRRCHSSFCIVSCCCRCARRGPLPQATGSCPGDALHSPRHVSDRTRRLRGRRPLVGVHLLRRSLVEGGRRPRHPPHSRVPPRGPVQLRHALLASPCRVTPPPPHAHALAQPRRTPRCSTRRGASPCDALPRRRPEGCSHADPCACMRVQMCTYTAPSGRGLHCRLCCGASATGPPLRPRVTPARHRIVAQ